MNEGEIVECWEFFVFIGVDRYDIQISQMWFRVEFFRYYGEYGDIVGQSRISVISWYRFQVFDVMLFISKWRLRVEFFFIRLVEVVGNSFWRGFFQWRDGFTKDFSNEVGRGFRGQRDLYEASGWRIRVFFEQELLN